MAVGSSLKAPFEMPFQTAEGRVLAWGGASGLYPDPGEDMTATQDSQRKCHQRPARFPLGFDSCSLKPWDCGWHLLEGLFACLTRVIGLGLL